MSILWKNLKKQFRENWIVPSRKYFNWNDFTWENDIEYTENWQIIYYPLFRYSNWNFVAWNNLDKYCSFTKMIMNEIEVKKKLFELRKKLNTIFQIQKNKEIIWGDSNITNIFVRKNRFPKFLIEDLEYRYRIYNILFNS